MKKTKWIALLLSALLMLSLFAACKPNDGETAPTGTGDTTPTGNLPDQPPASATPPLYQLTETLVYPDLAGFEKTVQDENVIYYNEESQTSVTMDFWPATPGQLAELDQGTWGPELESYFSNLMLLNLGELKSSQTVNLPGLNRKGLEMDVSFKVEEEQFVAKAMLIPAGEKIIRVFGMATVDQEESMVNGYNELIQNLKTE